jgi:tetratricopeptide (TPR) repeat protein
VQTDRWHKIESIYHSAVDHHQPAQRSVYLQEACGGDESLLLEVQSLLDQSPGATHFLETAAPDVAARELAEANTLADESLLVTQELPSVIGRYKVIRLLGEGGMATVYEAEQDQPRRVVALKVIKFGLANSDAVWRFQHECQALGRLQHPGIAQIYEAGTAETGFGAQPYLAMELIRGLTLDRYAKTTPLNLRQKLALMARICYAAHHAHQRGLIHRDLKPSNIVVDETGQPKVLDFGIARLAGEDPTSTGRTEYGRVVGTLSYMSPEQVLGDPLEVDTRSDVYSLGVILYELLAGRLPYEVSRRQVSESARVIREEEPTSLSSISRTFRGDIETMVGKALEKDKSRRYASAADLAADIERYLGDKPLAARPPSASYQLQKFVRRHRAGAAVAGVVLVALCGATVSVAWEARIARQERDRAQERFNDVRGLARHIIFDFQDELAAIPGTTQVQKDLVANAIQYLDTLAKEGHGDQSLKGELAAAYIRIGDIQGNPETQNLGDLPAALESYAKAERLARAMAAGKPSSQAKKLLGNALTAEAYGAKYANRGRRGAAIAMEALQIARERVHSDPASDDAQLQLGAALHCVAAFGEFKDNIPYLLEEASVFEGMLTKNPDDLNRRRNAALAHKNLAGTMLSLEDPDKAFIHLQRAEELDAGCVRKAPHNPQHKMDLAIDLGQWGEYYEAKNDIAKAMQYTRSALAIRRELASADTKNMWAQNRLAYSVNRLGDLQLNVAARQALASYQEARSIAERLQPESERVIRLAHAISGIGAAYKKLGSVDRSCAAYAESTKLYSEIGVQSSIYAIEAAQAEKAYSLCANAGH